MTQHQHIKGPYTVARMHISPKARDRRSGFVINTAWEDDGTPSMPVRICDLRTNTAMGFSEAQATATLLSAAPDLLAELDRSLAWIAKVAADHDGDGTGLSEKAMRQFDRNIAAIAKATGG